MSGWARRLPVGAELVKEGEGHSGVHVRVWAPVWQQVELVIEWPEARTVPLEPEPQGGYFSAFVPGLGAGATYRFRLGGDQAFPDPASRYQPNGPFGPSEVIDPDTFPWTDGAWTGIEPHRHVIYEMHVGTFTPEGTFAAAAGHLRRLAELGITTIELMPVADFAGRFGWGYDGVNLYAPSRLYGRPDDLRCFVDCAHQLGLAVILDVVYNHLGPSGNFLYQFSPSYKADVPPGEWGDQLNFDGPHSAAVREFFAANAGHWIAEYHLDGLRLDATQGMIDRSPEHVLVEVQRRAREAAGGRRIFLAAENESQQARHVRPVEEGGYGLDAMWNDDFHHSALVAATGAAEGYYHDYRGTPQELISAVKHGFLYQGQMYPWQRNPRGSPTRHMRRHQFINFLENHDQVANSAFGDRLHRLTSGGRYRALVALLLLTPGIPLLFQGQEFASSHRWYFFADHQDELAEAVRRGRASFATQFASLRTPESQAALADPIDRATYLSCVIDHGEREQPGHREAWDLHRDLLSLRRAEAAITDPRYGIDGAVIGPEALALRYIGPEPTGLDDRLLLVNLGPLLKLSIAPEPLMAPPEGASWQIAWSSEDAKYGGRGTPPTYTRAGFWISPHAAVLLAPVPGASLRREPPPPVWGPIAADPDWDPEAPA